MGCWLRVDVDRGEQLLQAGSFGGRRGGSSDQQARQHDRSGVGGPGPAQRIGAGQRVGCRVDPPGEQEQLAGQSVGAVVGVVCCDGERRG